MNARLYRLIFSKRLGMYVPVGDRVRACAGKKRRAAFAALTALTAAALAMPVDASQPAGMVPHATLGWNNAAIDAARSNATQLTIRQSAPKAILDWAKLNAKQGEALIFDQQGNRAWAALNRIHDADPSRFAGRLQADGQIYLINRNGIIFGNGAQVNVGGLVASTLNMSDELFLTRNGYLANNINEADFTFEGDADSFTRSLVRIEPGAEITAKTQGFAFFFAPRVENEGTVSTPEGQTAMAAGGKVYLTFIEQPADASARKLLEESLPDSLRGLAGVLVEVDPFVGKDAGGADVTLGGAVVNQALGKIFAERGNISVAALTVNQSGRMSATTSVNVKGSIRLLARDRREEITIENVAFNQGARTGAVVFGNNSITEVLPELSSSQTSLDEQKFNPSTVEVAGKTIHFEENSHLRAPGGIVTLNAQAGLLREDSGQAGTPSNGSRVDFVRGSGIDVAGTSTAAFNYWNNFLAASGRDGEHLLTNEVQIPMERNFIEVELRGNELKDAPLLRNGPLQARSVWVDIREGTPLADISGYTSQISRTVGERTAQGGSVIVKSEGDILFRDGARMDVSGGSLRYLDGYGQTSRLLYQGGSVDISEATPDRVYDSIVGQYVRRYEKWGVTEIIRTPEERQFYTGYREGRNAGKVEFAANALVLNGDLVGNTTAGVYQREKDRLPTAGELVIGYASQATQANPGFGTPDVLFALSRPTLPEDMDAASQAWRDQLTLSTDFLQNGGFSRMAVYSNGKISLPKGVGLKTPAGGAVTLAGRELKIAGDIVAPAGNIDLSSMLIAGLPDYTDTGIAVEGTISTHGQWVNDAPAIAGAGLGTALIDAGEIRVLSVSGLELGENSVVDVSGGGWLQADGSLQAGNGGSITLAADQGQPANQEIRSPMRLGGELRGYSMAHGGSLTLSAADIVIDESGSATAGELLLSPDIFQRGGFAQYVVSGRDNLLIAAGAMIAPRHETLVADASFATRESGADVLDFTDKQVLPEHLRLATDLTLAATSGRTGATNKNNGNLTLDAGASIRTDAGAAVKLAASRQLTVGGEIAAPAGSITLATEGVDIEALEFDDNQSIWLQSSARLAAGGDVRATPTDNGLRAGEVLNGGVIELNASRGYLVTEAGSLLDVSGASGVFDLPQEQGAGFVYRPVTVAGNAGVVRLLSREGMLLDGAYRAGAAAGGQGGSLELVLDAKNNYRSVIPFYPSGERIVNLSAAGSFVPAGLQPGAVIDTSTYNGRAFLALDRLTGGGFSEFRAKSEDVIGFDTPTSLKMERGIRLDAPEIAAAGTSAVDLQAAYVSLANADPDYQIERAATPGGASLNIQADLIDLEGKVALRGYGSASLNSDGDLRAKGVLNSNVPSLEGSFKMAGDLDLKADQIYPTTLSRFALASTGNIQLFAGDGDRPVYSAGGELAFEAKNILQQGVVKAPFGMIRMQATDSVLLAAGSRTSVSGEDLEVPFGRTDQTGRKFFYDYFNTGSFSGQEMSGLPEKSVGLTGPRVTVATDAQIDVSGSGDLRAWEFIAGPGGSRDVLAKANAPDTWAILPALGSAYAPFDYQVDRESSGVEPGSVVYLSGGAGLKAGFYTLLPARYAMLEGAYLASAVDGYRDLLPNQAAPRHDGSVVVAGYQGQLREGGIVVADSRTSGFLVRPGSQARTQSEYLDTLASDFFADSTSRLPGDAGRLALRATEDLVLDGDLRTAHGTKGRGAELDIVVPKLAVVSPGHVAPSDFVALDAQRLNDLNVSSLLLGATRTHETGGMRLDVGTGNVLISNDANQVLQAPEILLAATDRVEVTAGAALRASGSTGEARKILVGDDIIAGDGALLRLSTTASGGVLRSNVSRTGGDLVVGDGASLEAGFVTLDATRDNRFDGVLRFTGNGALELSAGRISMGDVDSISEGLAFDHAALAGFSSLDSLLMRSYSSIDMYGDVIFGSEYLDVTFDAGGLAGHAGINGAQAVSITARELAFRNTSAAPALAGVGASAGQFVAHTSNVTVGPGSFAVAGYDQVRLNAAREIVGHGKGDFSSTGDLTLTASRLTAATAAETGIIATGALRVDKPVTMAQLDAADGLGGNLRLAAQRIEHAGTIDLPAGNLEMKATGTGEALILENGSTIRTAGVAMAFGDTGTPLTAGDVTLAATEGDLRMDADAQIDVSGVAGGDAGGLHISAAKGGAELLGTLRGSADQDANGHTGRQGSFSLDVARLGDFSALNAKLETQLDGNGQQVAGGFGEARSYRSRQGGLTVAAGDTVTARDIALTVDAGNLNVYGSLDARAPKGGRIALHAAQGSGGANGNVTVHGTAKLLASATQPATNDSGTLGEGGTVFISTASADGTAPDAAAAQIDIRSGAVIDVSGAGVGRGGRVHLRAPRTGTGAGSDLAVRAIDGTITGAERILLEGYQVYDNVDTLTSGTATGTSLGMDTLLNDAASYLADANVSAIKTRLGEISAQSGFRLTPGVEVRNAFEYDGSGSLIPGSGDITLDADWNLYSTARPGGEPGQLTLRASGNVLINNTLSDGFTNANLGSGGKDTNFKGVSGDSWFYRMVAGADNEAADPSATLSTDLAPETGNFRVASGKMVRTGSGNIEIAAARDVDVKGAAVYTAGIPGAYAADSGDSGFVFPDGLNIGQVEAQFPSGGGDLSIHAGNNILGQAQTGSITGWFYRQGSLNSDGSFKTIKASEQPAWWTQFAKFTNGVGALGGGDVVIAAGGDISDLLAAAPTNARLGGSDPAYPSFPDARGLDVEGGGDLSVQAARDIYGGVYVLGKGVGRLSAGGSLLASESTYNVAIHLADAQMQVLARKEANMGEVSNPTTLARNFSNKGTSNFYYSYTPQTSLQVASATGNVIFDGSAVYPPSVRVEAPVGNITLNQAMSLYPAALGNLELLVGGSVYANAPIIMSDADPGKLPSIFRPTGGGGSTGELSVVPSGIAAHAAGILHSGDPQPVRIHALAGDIIGQGEAPSAFPKRTQIVAGGDVENFSLSIQNVDAQDVSVIQAGKRLVFTTQGSRNNRMVEVNGPGRLMVVTGDDIDLGDSQGLVSRGNLSNPFLPEGGSTLTLLVGVLGNVDGVSALPDYPAFASKYLAPESEALAGYHTYLQTQARKAVQFNLEQQQPTLGDAEVAALLDSPAYQQMIDGDTAAATTAFGKLDTRAQAHQVFFNELRTSGREAGDAAGPKFREYGRGETAITTLFPESLNDKPVTYSGDLNLFFSQIKTEQDGDIEIFVPGGLVNAGLASASTLAKEGSELGIVTVQGGDVLAYVKNDFLVNQSRIFTLGGDNILIWSADGNIDAGRGAKTTSATPPPQARIKDGQILFDISGSIAGSGIGVLLTRDDIVPGDVDLIAPRGEINAGDAGIRSVGNLSIAALRVVGADNIQVGGISTGVPVADTGSLAAGLTNVSSLSEVANATENLTQSMADSAKASQSLKDAFKPSFVRVEVLGFGE